MASSWLDTLKSAEKTSMVQDGRKKVHYTFKDGSEMVEEYDVRNAELAVRKWKRKGTLGGLGQWDFEVGEATNQPPGMVAEGLMESSSNPIFTRRDTRKAFQWRIRNLPYPVEVYNVKTDAESQCIIIRTSNKKYYKKFSIADMERCKLPLSQSALSIAHAHNTLIITYEKPKEILSLENQLQEEIRKMKASKDGDMECNPS